jgi:hypothetical protein
MTCGAEESPFVCCASKQVITSKSTKKVVRGLDFLCKSFTSAMPEKYSVLNESTLTTAAVVESAQ